MRIGSSALFIFVASLGTTAFAQETSWIETYSQCLHALNGTTSDSDDFLVGDYAGKPGMFLLPGNTAVFFPMGEPTVIDPMEDNQIMAGKFVRENYDWEWVQKGKPTQYVSLSKELSTGITTLSVSEKKAKSVKYKKTEAYAGFDERLRAQLKTKLKQQILTVTDTQGEELKRLGLKAPATLGSSLAHPGLKSRQDPTSQATSPKLYAHKLEVCEQSFAKVETADADLKKDVAKEIEKFQILNPTYAARPANAAASSATILERGK